MIYDGSDIGQMQCAAFWHGYTKALLAVQQRVERLGAWPLIRPVTVSREIMDQNSECRLAMETFARTGKYPSIDALDRPAQD